MGQESLIILLESLFYCVKIRLFVYDSETFSVRFRTHYSTDIPQMFGFHPLKLDVELWHRIRVKSGEKLKTT